MAQPITEPYTAATSSSFITVSAEAATDSSDLLEYRPSGDVRHWRDDDVISWSDDENGGAMSGESDVTQVSEKCGGLEDKTEQKNDRYVTDSQDRSDDAKHGSESTSQNHHKGSESINQVSSESRLSSTWQIPNESSSLAASRSTIEPLLTTKPLELRSVNSDGSMKTASGLSTVDEVDAVHPRLSSGSARRRPSHPAFVCDTCSRDTSGWQDCVDHAYRSGHGLAARCALCRLPAVRCRRKGRPGVWHRCVVTDTVRKMGVGNVAALVAGSHLTAPRPWRLSCGECGAAFAAKTARLVRHVIERGHSVERHCEKCLFPVFVFALNDERREMHVCVGNSAWLRKEEEALLATAGDDARYLTHFGENGEERGHGRRQNGGTPTHHHRHHHGHSHTGLDHHHEHQNGGFSRRSDDTTSSYHHQNSASKTSNGSTSSHYQTSISTNNGSSGDGGVGGMGHSSVSLPGGKLVVPLTAGTDRRWPEERTASCVAI